MYEETTDRHTRGFHLAVVAFFVTVIFVPWLDLFRPAEASGPRAAELREAAPAPAPVDDLEALADYPTAFEEHFNDTFGFRDWFLRGHSLVKLFAFGVSPTPRVLVGKQGWLFYTGDLTLEDQRGLCPFSASGLEAWELMLEARREFLAARGIDYLLVLVPNKEEVYPELLPDSVTRVGPRRIDQLVAHLREHTQVDVLDLRPAMIAAKTDPESETEPYLKLGTHWNGMGSYVAYKAVMEHLRELRPELAPPLALEDLQRFEVQGNADSWGRAMYLDDVLNQDVIAFRPRDRKVRTVADTGYGDDSAHVFTSESAPRVRAMLFHDSFGPYAYGLLSTGFARLACHWRSDFPVQTILAEQPDIVIEQFVQRWLINMHPDGGPPGMLDAASFGTLEHPLLRLDLPTDAERLGAVADCTLAVEGAGDDAGVRVTFAGPRDLLRLPEVQGGDGRAAILLDLTASDAGRLKIFFAEDDEALPLRKSSYRVNLAAGRQRVVVTLDAPGTTGRLFLRTAAHPGSIVLHAVEVRAPAAP